MLTKRDRELVERVKRIQEKAAKMPAGDYFKDMIRRGVIDEEGRLIRNGSARKKRVRGK